MTRRAPCLVAAPDKFRGTATAAEVAAAAVAAATRSGWGGRALPLADGGEGTLDAVGGETRVDRVHGPLGDRVDAEWRLVTAATAPPTAVIEMARASGLALLGGARANDPVAATTRGTGELVAAAVRAGARRVVVGCGGSATTDGGAGFVEALAGGPSLRGVELVAACDTRTRFLDAARVFGPQKGAGPSELPVLESRLASLASSYLDRFGVEIRGLDGGGAAGGLGGAIAALGGEIVSGFDLVAELTGLDGALDGADLLVTGEGCLDETSLTGKVVGAVLSRHAGRSPALVVVGTTAGVDASQLAAATGVRRDLVEVVDLVARFGRDRAVGETAALVEQVVAEALDAASSYQVD